MSKIKVTFKQSDGASKQIAIEEKPNFEEFKNNFINNKIVMKKWALNGVKNIYFTSEKGEVKEIKTQDDWTKYLSNKPAADTFTVEENKESAEPQNVPQPQPQPVQPSTNIKLKFKYTKDDKEQRARVDVTTNFEEMTKIIKEKNFLEDPEALKFSSTSMNEFEKIIDQETYSKYLEAYDKLADKKNEYLMITSISLADLNKLKVHVIPKLNLGVKPEENQLPLSQRESKLQKLVIDQLKSNFQSLKSNLPRELTETILKKEEEKFKANERNGLNDKEHPGIICNKCKKKIKGPRFICAECPKYNLCLGCERLENHKKDHFLLKFNEPIQREDERGYDCIIEGNNEVLTSPKENNSTQTVTIYNTGDKEWNERFFLLPIGYGEGFVAGKKITIGKRINPEEKFETKIMIDTKGKAGSFTSKWRMFTEKGIPFGEVIYIHLIKQ
ncbi:MAG: hypothetical protein MJ252_09545 [archaeon]|nr:hypothetical protein [archaeon]